ncbi:hypothetical protein A3D78_02600 [Candidatus Gottesmanbacteria bacterium RIFCSPHIGHO2_02_FULL_39_14]|uniref:Uncharacterized protein n=1 Tax=Candidatus Gottesmanbacteria bacterium RIFCSPHIGHO2_02_FULL_39_14 TaxID=1798383 RepID=A0A1F5ZZ57_9BACT|nr:MAG: hypothetical protein A3D78_02600 [Candidatus Gottesmanbacteria bacterium RIFCSPHIGHO2_02_FULL_39_14]
MILPVLMLSMQFCVVTVILCILGGIVFYVPDKHSRNGTTIKIESCRKLIVRINLEFLSGRDART